MDSILLPHTLVRIAHPSEGSQHAHYRHDHSAYSFEKVVISVVLTGRQVFPSKLETYLNNLTESPKNLPIARV
jgi:bisphosphoglycerate-independent phosphoglycerate mutase (AlkP superfamily)